MFQHQVVVEIQDTSASIAQAKAEAEADKARKLAQNALPVWHQKSTIVAEPVPVQPPPPSEPTKKPVEPISLQDAILGTVDTQQGGPSKLAETPSSSVVMDAEEDEQADIMDCMFYRMYM